MALEKLLFTDNASTTMSGTLANGGTTLVVAASAGGKFPNPSAGEAFIATLYELNVSSEEEYIEKAKCTARTADTFTIVRDVDGAVAAAGGPASGGYAYPSDPARTVYVQLRWVSMAANAMLTPAVVNAATDKDTPVDADALPIIDSEESNVLKKLTWANIKATAKTYFDTLYQPTSANLTEYAAVNPTAAGLALLDDADASAQRTTLGLGTMATETANNYAKKSADADVDMNNYKISEIKTATFNSQATLSTTTGAVTINWTAAQNYKQNEPTGTITYTFTAPPGPCHLQLLIDSDGTSTAQTINWPTLTWIGATWAGTNNKKAIINFWYDGTNYFAMGANQV
jgi:hypothetical protein